MNGISELTKAANSCTTSGLELVSESYSFALGADTDVFCSQNSIPNILMVTKYQTTNKVAISLC